LKNLKIDGSVQQKMDGNVQQNIDRNAEQKNLEINTNPFHFKKSIHSFS
jgi:hypothetical protein